MRPVIRPTLASNKVGRVSVFATATGVGSWPGTSAREAAEVVVGELHRMPHLVELPARGVGADMIGRAGALLVDIAIDTVPRGYRIAPGRGSVARRAVSLLDEDMDALEEAWEKAGLRGSERTVKVQAAWTGDAGRAPGVARRAPRAHRRRRGPGSDQVAGRRCGSAARATGAPAGEPRSSCSSMSRRCLRRWRAG